MIALIDYGLGNIPAFLHIYKQLNLPCVRATTAQALEKADKLILPGVGAFDWAMQRLEQSGMRPCLDELVLHRQIPVLGVCVGMQMMAGSSEEGTTSGLGWISGEVRRFNEANLQGKIRLPHMGWNDVSPKDHLLFKEMTNPRFYFLHSYYFSADSAQEILSETDYGGGFASAIHHEMIFGVQFHPEKSHHWGVQLLKNFADL